MADGIHSTGRGGAGNIGPDPTIYTDGSIVREGAEGVSLEGEYSTGRGGSGNIAPGTVQPSATPTPSASALPKQQQTRLSGPVRRTSDDIIPETAMRDVGGQSNFHTGRGGGGNVYKEKYGGHSNASSQAAAEKERERGGSGERQSVPEKIRSALGIGKSRSRSRSRGRA